MQWATLKGNPAALDPELRTGTEYCAQEREEKARLRLSFLVLGSLLLKVGFLPARELTSERAVRA